MIAQKVRSFAWRVAAIAAGCVLLGYGNAQAQSYTATDYYVLMPPAGFPDPFGLNYYAPASAAVGQVVGYSEYQPNFAGGDALLWTSASGAVTYLSPNGFDSSFTTATDGHQQVGAGEPGSILTHALLWSGTANSVVDLHPTVLAGFASSIAYGIGGGQQVGNGLMDAEIRHALLWTGTAASAIDIHPTGYAAYDSSLANGTDGIHQVGVMWNNNISYNPHAVLWTGTAASAVDLHPTNLAGFDQSTAYGVSGTQQVGDGSGPATSGLSHALVWSGTANSAIDLHPAKLLAFDTSHASGTNGVFQVGNVSNSMTFDQDAVLWNGAAVSAVDLASLLPFPSNYSDAFTIDSQSNVWGIALDSNHAIHAIEWSPVPEPTAFALFAASAAILYWTGRPRNFDLR